MPVGIDSVMKHATDPDKRRLKIPIENEGAKLHDQSACVLSPRPAMPEMEAAYACPKLRPID